MGHVQRINPTGNVQRTNPMGNVYKGPILWGQEACYKEPDASTEDQSYGTVHVATRTYARFQVRLYVEHEGPVIWELNMHKE